MRLPVTTEAAITFLIHFVGGGRLSVSLEANDLHEVAEQLRRERSLIGGVVPTADDPDDAGRVLIPAQRIALISEN